LVKGEEGLLKGEVTGEVGDMESRSLLLRRKSFLGNWGEWYSRDVTSAATDVSFCSSKEECLLWSKP
jgi:hypothetical protein